VSARPGRRHFAATPRGVRARWCGPVADAIRAGGLPYPAWDALTEAQRNHAADCPACSFAPNTITLCQEAP